MSARSAKHRYSVRRDSSSHKSDVRDITNPDELRALQDHLGWRAADAFLAEHIIYCEGPSDRVVLEAVVEAVPFSSERASNVVVTGLGGCGVLWGRDRSALKRNLDLLLRVAPHAKHTAILDTDGRPQGQIAALEKVLRELGMDVRWLPGSELEGSFLAEPVLRRLLAGHARDGGIEILAADADSAVAEFLAVNDDRRQPSDRLDELFKSLGLRGYDKVLGATIASHALIHDSPEAWAQLQQCVSAALMRT